MFFHSNVYLCTTQQNADRRWFGPCQLKVRTRSSNPHYVFMYCLHGELKLYQYNNPEKQGPRREVVCNLPTGFADDPEERGYRIDPIIDDEDDLGNPIHLSRSSVAGGNGVDDGADYEKDDVVNHLIFVVHGIGEELW